MNNIPYRELAHGILPKIDRVILRPSKKYSSLYYITKKEQNSLEEKSYKRNGPLIVEGEIEKYKIDDGFSFK